MEDIILIGGGGHCGSIIDTLKTKNQYNVVGIIDMPELIGKELNSVPYIGTDGDLQQLFDSGIQLAFLSVGSVGDTSLKRKLYNTVKSIGFSMPTIIDASALVSPSSTIGSGTFIGKGAIVNNNVTIGQQAIINSGAIIEHDTTIGDFCHIAPGSTLSGSVTVKTDTHVGTNTTIIQNITIGEKTVIGAGSVVISDIKACTVAYGNPCKEVSK